MTMTMIRTVISGSGGAGNNNSEALTDPGHIFRRRILTVAMLFTVVALPCFVLYHVAYPSESFISDQIAVLSTTTNYSSHPESEELKLRRVLKEASMKDKTVVLTTLNDAWAVPNSIVDLFLESFRIGDHTRKLLDHLVIIALDGKAYKRCLEVHPYCFALTTKGVDFSEEAYFMSPDYLEMMWRRIDFLGSVLEMGYNFIFSDADIMWFRDPFKRFYKDADFQIACDNFLGNSYDLNNRPNGGFTYVKSNKKTIQFYKFWYSSRVTYPGKHDQDVLNMIKYDPFFEKIGLKMRFLSTAYFGGLCEPSRNLNEVCTMHVNCCYGLDSKLHDLRVMLDDWRKYMSLSPSDKTLRKSSWSVPQNCSLANFHPYQPKKIVQQEKRE